MAQLKEDTLVIVAVDGSLNSECALAFYLEKLHRPEFTVGLLHAYEKPSLTIRAQEGIQRLDLNEIESTFRQAWDSADKIISKFSKICQDFGVEKFKEFLEHGKKPGEAICAVAEREQAAMIVVGSRGLSLLRRTFLGSVSEYVITHSKVAPVIVVPLPNAVQAQH